MSKKDKNKQSAEVNERLQAFSDDDDDFLDSMMEDVMGAGDNVEESRSAEPPQVNQEPAEVSKKSSQDNKESETAQQIEAVTEEIHDDKPKRANRRPGLLNRFNSGVDKETTNKEEVAPVNEDEEIKESPVKDVQEVKSARVKSGRRVPLLSRVSQPRDSQDDSDSSEVINEEEEQVTDSVDEVIEEVQDDLVDPGYESQEVPESTKEITSVDEGVQADLAGLSEDVMDSLDDMLEGLEEEEDVEQLRRNIELDPEVKAPLEKPKMNDIVVTPDGKSLADMFLGSRSGNRPVAEVISRVRNQDEVIDIDGKKFTDNRYTKHIEVIDEETSEQEKRIALSNKFLQRNAEYTEPEKIIMKNLGLTNAQLANVMRSDELSKRQKNEVLGLGRYGAEKHFKGRRYRTTVGDSALLEFLVKFKFANTRILRWLSNEPQGRTWRKLSRLRNSGLVESQTIIGIPDLWGATDSGTAIAGYDLNPGLRPMPKIPTISSDMGVNYVAACLWFNSVNVLNLDDFPAHNKIISLQNDGRDRVRGETLVSELEIRSNLGKEINPLSTTMQSLGDERLYDVISSNVRTSIEEWHAGGKVGNSPEFHLGNEYMWILFPTSQLTLSHHVPDLVVKRERGPNGEPRSLAIEIERYEKGNNRYDQIMLAYKLDEHLYEEVIWITPNSRVARALENAAIDVGFDRYSIIPIITEDGVYDKQDIWMI